MTNFFFNHQRFVFIVISALLSSIGLYAEFFLEGLPEYQTLFTMSFLVVTLVLLITTAIVIRELVQLKKLQQKLDKNPQYIAPSEVNPQDLKLPSSIGSYTSELKALGFESFVILDVSDAGDASNLEWYWLDKSHQVHACLIYNPTTKHPSVSLVSILEDEAVIETVYRVRVQIKSEKLHVRNVTSSLFTAYNYHLQQIAFHKPIHGNAIAIQSSENLIDWNKRINDLYQGLVLQNRIDNTSNLVRFVFTFTFGLSLILIIAQWISLMLSISILSLVVIFVVFFVYRKEPVAPYGSLEEGKKT